MTDASKGQDEKTPWQLIPLTPQYLEREHGSYVEALLKAIDGAGILNIALSGDFGVGKSSILGELAKRHKHRVVELSLSNLTPIDASPFNDSLPTHATTPTNRIQQEIVKQLLYRVEPKQTPDSRFRRIERFAWRRELVIAGLFGLVTSIAFFLAGWSTRIGTRFVPDFLPEVTHEVVVWVVAGLIVLIVRRLYHGRLHIRQVSAGSATVALDDKSISYFDQYLDEIMYFFEATGRDVVIFEDIDRFNDVYIFDTLRSLNTLLNASRQDGQPIRFIYAIKDSIFEETLSNDSDVKTGYAHGSGANVAHPQTVGATRTKFFDLIIPVVPFITHQSARNLAIQVLDGVNHNVDIELLDLASRHVPEMRLLKNVRNEFVVFRDRIFSGDGERLLLSETDLFAMMLYKSIHLADFEAIRTGSSRIDRLYELGRTCVLDNIRRYEQRLREIRAGAALREGRKSRSIRLGDRLGEYVNRIARHVGQGSPVRTFTLANGVNHTDIHNETFWIQLVEGSGPLQATLQNRQALSFTLEDLSTALGDRLVRDEWQDEDRENGLEAEARCVEAIAFLRGADLRELIERPEFEVELDGAEQSLDSIAKSILGTGLAYQLVKDGYLNRNFTLYTSTFHGTRVGPAATNFMIHHVDRNVMDEHFALSGIDVDAVLRERGEAAFSEVAMYNIAILDHLLATNQSAADILIRSLARLGGDQRRFLQAYLAGGEERAAFVRRFTSVSPQVLVFLAGQVEVDHDIRVELISLALGHLSGEIQYRTDSVLATHLATHFDEHPSVTSTVVAPTAAKRVAGVFANAGIRLSALRPLTQAVRNAFIDQNLYAVTRENLQIAAGGIADVALDRVRDASRHVYDYVLDNLDAYLSAIDGVSATVATAAGFTRVIEDVLENVPDLLEVVILRASGGCSVTSLSEVSEQAWTLLVRHRRTPATFANVLGYLQSRGEIDADLAGLMEDAGAIETDESIPENQKRELAKAILAAKDVLPSGTLRTRLVASLKLAESIPGTEIEAERGELFALLIEAQIIESDASTYGHLSDTDWATKERVVQASTRFQEYMTPGLVQPDLAEMLLSDRVDVSIKSAIAGEAEVYSDGASVPALKQLARFAAEHERVLPVSVIKRFANAGVGPEVTVDLLEPHLGVLERDELFSILVLLGHGYADLTERGREKVRIPSSRGAGPLLAALERHAIVSSFIAEGAQIKVTRKYK